MPIKKNPDKVLGISIPGIERTVTRVVVVSLPESSLIVHRMGKREKDKIKEKQSGATKTKKREKRDPEKEFMEAQYFLPDGKYAFKHVAFKKSMMEATTLIDGLPSTLIKRVIHPVGFFVEIHSPEPPVMREDEVVIGINTKDLRYRPEFKRWWAQLELEYQENQISTSQVIALLNLAGYSCGVGDMRPGRSGYNMGRFRVATPAEVKKLQNLKPGKWID